MQRRTEYFKRGDIVIYLLLVFLFFQLALNILQFPEVKAEKAEIYVDGRLEYVYPLQEEQKLFFVDTPIGGVNVEIKDKKIRVTTSNSPLKLCVKQGWIDGVGESIIGVPDRLLIQIVGEISEDDEDYVDGVVR
ncbi:NusG domain II-containing protein [Fusobacterium gonidiaformans]|uniref:NusG domain II-containing protein n=1 Tax=Fusobacterium gonidiaformans TaxID=849 RepID=UPI0001BC6537|nr:NusG domain II-containing protein [Fusobacterium gonidiaformans]AVQ16669.1 hypothetical protein C4N16_03595 [Fusobacterium gonidiaformans ATCC 25563]EFS28244.1 hypothetical protein FGAG_00565 [Fusobacterium gonidiaformans ATCC 25563]